MRKCLLLVALISGFGLSDVASAQSVLKSYVCDATPGHYSMISLELGPEQKTISGMLYMQQLYRHKSWKPSAGIALGDGRNEGRIFVGSEIPAQDVVKSGMPLTFSVMAGPITARNTRKDLFQVELGTKIPFALTLDKGRVDYVLGDRSGSMEVDLRGKIEVMLSCSTGAFNFEELKQY